LFVYVRSKFPSVQTTSYSSKSIFCPLSHFLKTARRAHQTPCSHIKAHQRHIKCKSDPTEIRPWQITSNRRAWAARPHAHAMQGDAKQARRPSVAAACGLAKLQVVAGGAPCRAWPGLLTDILSEETCELAGRRAGAVARVRLTPTTRRASCSTRRLF
jgi:hypothetical protein